MMEGPVHPGGGLGPAREKGNEKEQKKDEVKEGNNDHDADGA